MGLTDANRLRIIGVNRLAKSFRMFPVTPFVTGGRWAPFEKPPASRPRRAGLRLRCSRDRPPDQSAEAVPPASGSDTPTCKLSFFVSLKILSKQRVDRMPVKALRQQSPLINPQRLKVQVNPPQRRWKNDLVQGTATLHDTHQTCCLLSPAWQPPDSGIATSTDYSQLKSHSDHG